MTMALAELFKPDRTEALAEAVRAADKTWHKFKRAAGEYTEFELSIVVVLAIVKVMRDNNITYDELQEFVQTAYTRHVASRGVPC